MARAGAAGAGAPGGAQPAGGVGAVRFNALRIWAAVLRAAADADAQRGQIFAARVVACPVRSAAATQFPGALGARLGTARDVAVAWIFRGDPGRSNEAGLCDLIGQTRQETGAQP